MFTDLSSLNEQQRDSVLHSVDKNVVLLAGAGSGKTFTMIKRTEYLITDCNVSPSEIMLVTFTNKAASEIKKRISQVSPNYNEMFIGTFHSICVKFLRMFGSHMGITRFSILDQKESRKVLGTVLDKLGINYDNEQLKEMQASISKYKNEVIKPSSCMSYGASEQDYNIYLEYQKALWKAKTFDFDDLIIYTILLISKPEVQQWIRENIHYVMVDEMQDSNKAQFILINLFANDNNIFMVGDVNQSIYGFRNARPELLNSFVNEHNNTIQLKLEQNYRSTKTIINAANKLINHNTFGTKLTMFCDNEKGEKVQDYLARNPYDEAEWVVSEIISDKNFNHKDYSNYAIIYRANYQSRIIEEALTKEGIPYIVFGATSFYSRKESRDLLAFCNSIINPADVESFSRVLNTVKGIGKKTISDVIACNPNNFVDALGRYIGANGYASNKLVPIYKVLSCSYTKCSDVIANVILLTDYRKKFMNIKTEDASESMEIIDEFQEMLVALEKEENCSMEEIVDKISLLSYSTGEDKANQNAVKLMTAHASKGLEFDTVFVIGCEEGSFPHANSLCSVNPKDSIEEERRLFYVAMTRAEKKLYLTHSSSRIKRDVGTVSLKDSRFLSEIPEELVEVAF